MKSLRRIGSSRRLTRCPQVLERAAELGAPRSAPRAPRRRRARRRRRSSADLGARADLPRARRAALELGDQRHARAHQRLAERPVVAARLEPALEVAQRDLAHARSTPSRAPATSCSSLLIRASRRLSRCARARRSRTSARSARVDRFARPRSIPLREVLGAAARDHDRGAGVEHRDVARRPPRRRGSRGSWRRSPPGVPPAIASSGARSSPSSSGAHEPLLGPRRPRPRSTRVAAAMPISSMPSSARDHERALAAEPDERLGDRLLVVAVRDAEQLAPGAGGVGQRAEEVEDRAHARAPCAPGRRASSRRGGAART